MALFSLVGCASASAALNLSGTWSAVYHCEVTCAGSEDPATDTLTQAEGSEVVTGSNGTETITGTLKGNTFEFVSKTEGGYEAKATLTVAADGQSWSGPLSDSNSTSGTYTATRDAVVPGSLSPLASPFNCVGEVGYPGAGEESRIGCGTLLPAKALENSYEAQVSPDGRFAYSVAEEGDLIEYSRNLANGELTEIGCVTASTEPCAPANVTEEALEMKAPQALAISADGASVYVVTFEGVLVEFGRDSETGLLKETGCIGHEATSACAVKGAKGLHEPYGVTVSPSGKNVYVASNGDDAVAEFSRSTVTGALTQLASPNNCISSSALSECGTIVGGKELERAIGLVVSPDEKNVYVAAGATEGGGAIVALERDEAEEGALELLPMMEACVSEVLAECTPGVEINGPESLVISPDGKNVYANSFKDNAVLDLRREASGALVQPGYPNACVMKAPAGLDCTQGVGLGGALGVAISPDGENVYVSSSAEDDEAAFTRDPETGVLTQLSAPYECSGKMETEGVKRNDCGVQGVRGIAGARRVTVSPDGRNLYVAGQNDHAIVELDRAVPPSVESPLESVPVSGSPVTSIAPAIPSVIIPPAIVPPPVLAHTANVAAVSGTVLVKLPGTSKFVPLSSLEQIPFGSTIEATHGTVSVTTAEPGGTTQTGEFFEGEFILRQGANGVVIAELTGGNFSVCPTKRERAHIADSPTGFPGLVGVGLPGSVSAGSPSASAASASGSHVVRKLWANAHGKFSTKGNYAAGAVQGTEWLTEDLCDGTYIKVTRDKVAVTNLVNHHHVEVTTGHHYLAKAP